MLGFGDTSRHIIHDAAVLVIHKDPIQHFHIWNACVHGDCLLAFDFQLPLSYKSLNSRNSSITYGNSCVAMYLDPLADCHAADNLSERVSSSVHQNHR